MNSGTSEHKSVISERTDPPDNLKVNRTVHAVGMRETQEAIFLLKQYKNFISN